MPPAIGPRLSQICWPDALTPVILYTIQGLLAVPTPCDTMAGVALKSLFKVFFALGNTGRGGGYLAAKIQHCPGFVFLKNRGKGFNVRYELLDLLFVIKPSPGRHRRRVQPVIDAPENILIARQLVAIGRFMVRAELVNTRREISWFGVDDSGGDALAVAIFPMTVLTAVQIELLPGLSLRR